MTGISVFDIFKIGIGPSSSHTMGPWRAAQAFLQQLDEQELLGKVRRLTVDLFGSLAKTGKGHGTDIAVLLGLSGEDPVTIPVAEIDARIKRIVDEQRLVLRKEIAIPFPVRESLRFHFQTTHPGHPNALTLTAELNDREHYTRTYFSVGGGFILEEHAAEIAEDQRVRLPFPIQSGADLSRWCRQEAVSIFEIVMRNERAWRAESETRERLHEIWEAMLASIYRGVTTRGVLPGGLNVTRRAYEHCQQLLKGVSPSSPHELLEAVRRGTQGFHDVLSWVSCFALAVNEENASFGRVVTAPTNGAAGVIPAVLMYYLAFAGGKGEEDVIRFLSVAAEIGSIFKKGATISAAMGGCQAEIGVSSAMAAAALTECLGGNPEQAIMAAEIAMEHHLGLTCDPIGGLVQIPCIERNTMGAVKAITASQLALQGNPASAKVSLDGVIKTMWETALDMNQKYKETSDGGLATNISVNLSEC